ncbi:hypothetical protein GS504_03245 [Rhodococcus hoagii]|nr:hypothetical protein [Prescottella equi]
MNWASDWLDDTEPNTSAEHDRSDADHPAATSEIADETPGPDAEIDDAAPDPDAEVAAAAVLPSSSVLGPSGVLVVGVGGGVGTTTTAAGLAAALRTNGFFAAGVDASADGGDLIERTVGHSLRHGEWMLDDGILWGRRALGDRAGEALAASTSDSLLRAVGYFPVYDAGNALHARHLEPLITDPALSVVLVVASRGDSVNRLPARLDWIRTHIGEDALEDVTVAVATTRPGRTPVAEHLRTHLEGHVSAVCEIGHDTALATGGQIRWEDLNEAARADYRQLAAAIQAAPSPETDMQ